MLDDDVSHDDEDGDDEGWHFQSDMSVDLVKPVDYHQDISKSFTNTGLCAIWHHVTTNTSCHTT